MSFRVGSNAVKANGGLTVGGSGMSAATPPSGPGEITQWPIEKKIGIQHLNIRVTIHST